MNFAGCAVTKPNKVNIMKYLDETDPLCTLAGSSNTIVIKDGKLIGYNTDATGFSRALTEKYVKSDAFYFDACYNPEKTQFLLNAEKAGAAILNGLSMSLYQGVDQIRLWTGEEPPVEIMRETLDKITKK